MVTLDPKALRRMILAHCLTMAERDEAYARWAANDYERNPVYGGLFDGLGAKFDAELSRSKAAKEVTA